MKKDINIDFKKLSADPRVLVVIIVLACAALIALCVYTNNQTKLVEDEIQTQVSAFENNKQSIENLLLLKARSDQYLQRNEEYEALLTSDGLSQEEFMIYFDKFCKQYDCRMTLIEFGGTETIGDVQSLSIRLTVEGEFENLMAICDGIVTQDRFYRIDEVTFAMGSQGKKVATINVVAFSK